MNQIHICQTTIVENTYVAIASEWTAWANRNNGKSWSILQEDKNDKENILKLIMWRRQRM